MRRYRNLSGRALAAASSTVLLVGLSACGGGGGGSASDDLPEEGATVEPAEFVDDMQAGLEASTTAQMTMTVDAGGTGGLDAEGVVDYSSDPVSMSITSTNPMSDDDMELILLDGIMYMNQGSLTNDKFVSYDLSDTANLPPALAGLEDQVDPLAAFREFEPAIKTVTFEGEDEVGGEQLAHYVLVLDPAKMESFADAPMASGLPDELEYDLYFDDEFRIRQADMSMEMSPPIDIAITLSEWGEPVDIAAPPAEDTVDGSQMAG